MNSTTIFALAMIKYKFESGIQTVRSIIDRMYTFIEEQKEKMNSLYEQSKIDLQKAYEDCNSKQDYLNYFFYEANCDSYFEEESYVSEVFLKEAQYLLVVLMYKTFENSLCYAKRTMSMYLGAYSSIFRGIFNRTGLEEIKCVYNCIKHSDSIVGDELHKNYPEKYEKKTKLILDREKIESFFEDFEKEMRNKYKDFDLKIKESMEEEQSD